MPSNAAKGAYYKARAKKWLEARGYQVADLEKVYWIRGKIPVKRDQFGADLLAVSADRIAFVQVKGGRQAEGQGQFPDAKREFDRYQFPDAPIVRKVVLAFAPGRRGPRVLEM